MMKTSVYLMLVGIVSVVPVVEPAVPTIAPNTSRQGAATVCPSGNSVLESLAGMATGSHSTEHPPATNQLRDHG